MRFFVLLIVICVILSGCGTTETVVERDLHQYRAQVIQDDDSASVKTGKIISRVLVGTLTLGLNEAAISDLKDRIALYKKYDSYIGKDRVSLFREEGAPTKIQEDGSGGCVASYEVGIAVGNTNSHPLRGKVTTFFFNKEGKCTGWHLRID